MDLTPALAPADRDECAAALADATGAARSTRIVGGGTASRRGWDVPAAQVLSTAGLDRVVAYEPADLTLTVEGGVPAARVADVIAPHGQVWPQAAYRPGATVGGLLATAGSTFSRLRWGPVRDSLLEVVVATGDGRLVRAGGRTVKGVAGYDLPRLMVGAHGTLGVLVEATLKLWPAPAASGWFTATGDAPALVQAARTVMLDAYRAGAVLLTPGTLYVHLLGADADVTAPAGMVPAPGPPSPAWDGTVQVGVSPARVGDLSTLLAGHGDDYVAQVGVGVCHVEVRTADDVDRVRGLAAGLGGHAQVTDAPAPVRRDPWGPPPAGLDVMRRMRQAFDPAAILNPGLAVWDAPAAPV